MLLGWLVDDTKWCYGMTCMQQGLCDSWLAPWQDTTPCFLHCRCIGFQSEIKATVEACAEQVRLPWKQVILFPCLVAVLVEIAGVVAEHNRAVVVETIRTIAGAVQLDTSLCIGCKAAEVERQQHITRH